VPVPVPDHAPTTHPAQTAGSTTASPKTHRRPHDPAKAGSGAPTAKPAQGSGSATVPIETDL
jgi:hypothetical protein